MSSLFPTGRLARRDYHLVRTASNRVVKGQVSFVAGENRDCYLKFLDQGGFYREAISAFLALKLNVDIPQPYLVSVGSTQLKVSDVDLLDWTVNGQVFGTRALIALPIKKSFASGNSNSLESRLRAWPGLLRSVVFDQIILNTDRTASNLLTNGRDFWLIDHDQALLPTQLLPGALEQTKLVGSDLLSSLVVETQRELNTYMYEIRKICNQAVSALETVPYELLLMSESTSELYDSALRKRCEQLPDLFSEYFGRPSLSLYNPIPSRMN